MKKGFQDISKVYGSEKAVDKGRIIEKLLKELNNEDGNSERLLQVIKSLENDDELTEKELELIRKIANKF